MKIQKLAQSGRSMIEMLGVLAIVGALSVGGIAGYTKAMFQYRINKDIEIITQTVTNMQTLYASQTGNCKYSGGEYECDEEGFCRCSADMCEFSDAILKQIIPNENPVLPTGAWIDPQPEGLYKIYDGKNLNSKGFVIILHGLSQKECIALATYDWGSRTTGLIAYSAGDDVISDCGVNSLATYNCQGTKGPVSAMWYSDINIAIACPGGSVVGVPMLLNVAVDACANCDDDPEIGCTMQFFFE